MIISTGVNNETPELADRFGAAYVAATVHSYDQQVAACFAGLELVEPGRPGEIELGHYLTRADAAGR